MRIGLTPWSAEDPALIGGICLRSGCTPRDEQTSVLLDDVGMFTSQ